jgi:hypothetical protein
VQGKWLLRLLLPLTYARIDRGVHRVRPKDADSDLRRDVGRSHVPKRAAADAYRRKLDRSASARPVQPSRSEFVSQRMSRIE